MSIVDPVIASDAELPYGDDDSDALDQTAARYRAAGLYVLLATVGADGVTVEYHDEAASPFFRRYVLGSLRGPGAEAMRAAANVVCGGAVSFYPAPGVLAVARPIEEPGATPRRRPPTPEVDDPAAELGVPRRLLVVAARAVGFPGDVATTRGQAVEAECQRQGLDVLWVIRSAGTLPSYEPESLAALAEAVAGTLADRRAALRLTLEADHLADHLANSYEELSLLHQVSRGMRVDRDPAGFFAEMCAGLRSVFQARGVGVIMCHPERRDAGAPLAPTVVGPAEFGLGGLARMRDEVLELLVDGGVPLLIGDVRRQPGMEWLAEWVTSLVAVPLQREEAVLGFVFAVDKEAGEFDDVDARLLSSVASSAAVYLENSLLFEDVHGLMMGLLHSLTRAVDAKDAYTSGHSERVARLSRMVALEAGMSEAEASRAYMAGLLHDVGKIGVPEAVLTKPGRLTDAEMADMRRHPQIGANILKDIRGLRDVVPAVMHHHERFEGGGYPSGIAGRSIPLLGRIVGLTDALDAMTSNRTYRASMTLETALAEIRKSAGSHFDPDLTAALGRIGVDRLREELASAQLRATSGDDPAALLMPAQLTAAVRLTRSSAA